MDVSVVIPTFNRQAALSRCLNAMPHDVEVVVVDDGATDGTGEVVNRCQHPKLRYVKQLNRGPASARNAGIQAARGGLIVFTDDDCVPLDPWPWPLVERMKREQDSVAGVGGRVIPFKDGVFSRYYTFHRILEPPESCSYLVTANCLYRRDALELVGGFDEGIKHPGGEDTGIAVKIRDAGLGLVYEPRAIVRHEYRESLVDFVRTFYRYGKGCGYDLGE